LIVSFGQASYSGVARQDTATAAPPERRTQAERSARTRERLLDATLDCLAERGWAGTTTTEVAERAGVSRGAQLHHFPTRSELVAAAVGRLAERRMAEFSEAVSELPPDSDWVSAGIDLLWQAFQDPTAHALLELLVAARTDPELRASLAPVAREMDARLDAFAAVVFPEPFAGSPRLSTLRRVGFLLLQGLAVARILDDDPEHRDEILGFLKDLSHETLATIQKERP
jgi:AcrR family transcriptional regulator